MLLCSKEERGAIDVPQTFDSLSRPEDGKGGGR
jgi:hypothetical protein